MKQEVNQVWTMWLFLCPPKISNADNAEGYLKLLIIRLFTIVAVNAEAYQHTNNTTRIRCSDQQNKLVQTESVLDTDCGFSLRSLSALSFS